MKKTIVLMAAALLAAGASADTKKMLEVKEYNGTSHKYDITEVINITFDGDRMVVNHATDGLREHDIEAIEVMRFATVSGLYEFELDEGLEVTVSDGILRATYPENTLPPRLLPPPPRHSASSTSTAAPLQPFRPKPSFPITSPTSLRAPTY